MGLGSYIVGRVIESSILIAFYIRLENMHYSSRKADFLDATTQSVILFFFLTLGISFVLMFSNTVYITLEISQFGALPVVYAPAYTFQCPKV